jgi:RNA recognition motif-containing protein
MIKLFVGGFPLDITEIELVQLFSRFGDVSTIKIVRDRKTRMCKGYAFIEMLTEQGARDAIAGLHETPMEDRHLTVKFADEKPAVAPQRRMSGTSFTRNTSNNNADTRSKRPRRDASGDFTKPSFR